MHKNDSPAALIGPRIHKWFKYRPDSSLHQFRSFEVKGSLVIYATHLSHFTCSVEKCWEEMADWNEVEPPATVPGTIRYEPQLPALPPGMADNFEKLFGLVMATTERVVAGTAKVEEANAINNLTQTGINLGRLQLDTYRLLVSGK